MSQKPLSLVIQPQAYFQELVTGAIENQKVQVLPETEVYLVNLLHQFMVTENLYRTDENGNLVQEPLALLVKEAVEEPSPEVQRLMFRKVGDVSLYVSGFFQDSLNRKLVDVDYYIDMGGTAYQQVAASSPENVMKATYGELGGKFGAFVDVLAEVSVKTLVKNDENLIRTYENWVRTGSERAAKLLKEAGIHPVKNLNKNQQ